MSLVKDIHSLFLECKCFLPITHCGRQCAPLLPTLLPPPTSKAEVVQCLQLTYFQEVGAHVNTQAACIV